MAIIEKCGLPEILCSTDQASPFGAGRDSDGSP